jgi:UTP-glucose-1-phosphate uridylyltransferase
MTPTLLIMAAGIGSRYGGIKQLDGFGPSGEKIIDYTIYDAIQSGFGKIVFVIRHDIEADFCEAVTDRWQGRIPVEYTYQELNSVPTGFTVPSGRQKPWGTGHAILTAAPLIHEPFSAVNADDFYGRSSLKTIFSYLASIENPEKSEYCLIGYLLKNTLSEYGSVARGICRQDAGGHLVSLVETPGIHREGSRILYQDPDGRPQLLDGNTLVSMNIWGFTTSFFSHLETDFNGFLERRGRDPMAEFYLTTVVDRVIRSGLEKVKVLSTDQQWFGVTFREDRPMVERSIRKLVADGMYPENLWK